MTLDEVPSLENQFYCAVGRALSRWYGIEVQLAHVFCNLVHPNSKKAANAAYWAVQSFSARLTMVDKALIEALSGQNLLIDEWTSINKKLTKTYKQNRNKIAHGSVSTWARSVNGVSQHGVSFYFNIFQASRNDDFDKRDGKYFLTLERIEEIEAEFGMCMVRLMHLSDGRVFRPRKFES